MTEPEPFDLLSPVYATGDIQDRSRHRAVSFGWRLPG